MFVFCLLTIIVLFVGTSNLAPLPYNPVVGEVVGMKTAGGRYLTLQKSGESYTLLKFVDIDQGPHFSTSGGNIYLHRSKTVLVHPRDIQPYVKKNGKRLKFGAYDVALIQATFETYKYHTAAAKEHLKASKVYEAEAKKKKPCILQILDSGNSLEELNRYAKDHNQAATWHSTAAKKINLKKLKVDLDYIAIIKQSADNARAANCELEKVYGTCGLTAKEVTAARKAATRYSNKGIYHQYMLENLGRSNNQPSVPVYGDGYQDVHYI